MDGKKERMGIKKKMEGRKEGKKDEGRKYKRWIVVLM